MTERTFSRLARGLGPLGVAGSLLLHAGVLAAVLRAPLPRDTVPPATPRVTVALVTLAPPPPPEPAPQADTTPPPAPAREPENTQATPDPRPAIAPSAAPPPPKPRPVKPTPRPARPTPPPEAVAAAPAVAPETATEGPVAASDRSEPTPPAPVHLTAPTFRHRPAPAYPAQAQRDEIEGTVRLKLLIGADGRVAEVNIVRSSGHRLLDQAALSAAQSWILEPAQKNGTPTPAWAEVDVPFRLTD